MFSESTFKNKSLLETPLHCNYPCIKHEIKRNKDRNYGVFFRGQFWTPFKIHQKTQQTSKTKIYTQNNLTRLLNSQKRKVKLCTLILHIISVAATLISCLKNINSFLHFDKELKNNKANVLQLCNFSTWKCNWNLFYFSHFYFTIA